MTESFIFRSTSQCLHVSFLMEILPATQRSFMQAMLEAHMKSCGVWEDPKATDDRAINFGGMKPLEIRGQCAMVRSMVEHHLTQPECFAVKAHYGHTTTKAAGVRCLADYVSPLLTTTSNDAVLALAWGVFGNEKQREGLSVRAISSEFGLSKDTAVRDQKRLARMGRELLARAIGRLDERFRSTGLVE